MLILLTDAPKLQVSGMDHADKIAVKKKKKIAVNTSEECGLEGVIFVLFFHFP